MRAGAVSRGFRDITAGTNGAYRAGPGWDACTGLGTPIGTKLIAVVKPGGATATAKKSKKKSAKKTAAKKKKASR